jgi:hypothetical protein
MGARAATTDHGLAAPAAHASIEARTELVDFGDDFVMGDGAPSSGRSSEGDAIAGASGSTASASASTSAQGATSRAPDRSRPPRLAGDAQWAHCGFPEEADEVGMNEAMVMLRVSVDAGGALRAVDALRDPGFGFGRLAKRCAERSRWLPALDHEGHPVARTHLLSVRFER